MNQPRPLRILHVISSLDSESGGPAEGVRRITECELEQGAIPSVVSLDSPASAHLDLGHLKALGLGPASLGTFGYSPMLVPWLRLHGSSFDAVVVHGLWQYIGVAVWHTLRAKVPYFVYPHGMLDPWFNKAYPLKFAKKSLYWLAIQSRVLADAASVLFTCDVECELARQSFKPYSITEKVVNYGTVKPRPKAGWEHVFYQAHPTLRDARVFLFLGRLHEKKGCDLLLEAFKAVLAHDVSAHLVYAGPDNDNMWSNLRRRALDLDVADRVHWVGMLRDDMKWSALAAAEAFVLPSHQENFGIAVAEALAMGTPVLVSDKVNIWKEINDASAGIVGPDTLHGTIELLQRWQHLTSEQRETMSIQAKRLFTERFDIRIATANLLTTIQSHLMRDGLGDE